MMRHEVNFLHEVSRDAIEFAEAGGDIRAYSLLRPYYTALVFSMGHPVLRRREVRVAINEAIDRDELVRNGMRGHGEIAEGPFWPNHWAYPQGRFPVSFNPEAAKLRLESVGLKIDRRHTAADAGAVRVLLPHPGRRRALRADRAARAAPPLWRGDRHADRTGARSRSCCRGCRPGISTRSSSRSAAAGF